MKIVFLSRTLTSGWSLRRPLPWRLQSCDPLGALAVELVCTTAFSRRGCGGSTRAWSEFVTYGMLCAGRAKGNEHRRENVFWAWVQIHQGTFEIYAQSRRVCHGDAPSHGRHMYVRYPPATVAPIGYRAFWSVRLRLAADRCQCQCRRCARVWCVWTPCPCMHDPVSVYDTTPCPCPPLATRRSSSHSRGTSRFVAWEGSAAEGVHAHVQQAGVPDPEQ